jgi:hypothetical protein
MDVGKSVHGETEIIFERPVCAGETLRGEIRVGNIYEKQGKRGGKMNFIEMEIEYFDENDKPVAIARNIFIERG